MQAARAKTPRLGSSRTTGRVGPPSLFTLASAAARSGVSLEQVRDGLRSVGLNALLSVDDLSKQVRLFARDVMRKESTGDLPFPPEE